MKELLLGDLEVYNVHDKFLELLFMSKKSSLPILPTNLAWERLSLKPITLAKLKPRLRSGSVRVALATSSGLRILTITRHPLLAGRKARKTKRGFWEVYESGYGWVSIQNECSIWLAP